MKKKTCAYFFIFFTRLSRGTNAFRDDMQQAPLNATKRAALALESVYELLNARAGRIDSLDPPPRAEIDAAFAARAAAHRLTGAARTLAPQAKLERLSVLRLLLAGRGATADVPMVYAQLAAAVAEHRINLRVLTRRQLRSMLVAAVGTHSVPLVRVVLDAVGTALTSDEAHALFVAAVHAACTATPLVDRVDAVLDLLERTAVEFGFRGLPIDWNAPTPERSRTLDALVASNRRRALAWFAPRVLARSFRRDITVVALPHTTSQVPILAPVVYAYARGLCAVNAREMGAWFRALPEFREHACNVSAATSRVFCDVFFRACSDASVAPRIGATIAAVVDHFAATDLSSNVFGARWECLFRALLEHASITWHDVEALSTLADRDADARRAFLSVVEFRNTTWLAREWREGTPIVKRRVVFRALCHGNRTALAARLDNARTLSTIDFTERYARDYAHASIAMFIDFFGDSLLRELSNGASLSHECVTKLLQATRFTRAPRTVEFFVRFVALVPHVPPLDIIDCLLVNPSQTLIAAAALSRQPPAKRQRTDSDDHSC